MLKNTRLSILPALLVVLAACNPAAPAPTSPPASAPPSAGASASASSAPSATPVPEPTGNLVEFMCTLPFGGEGNTDHINYTDVRVGTHDGYDRIAFQFAGDTTLVPPVEMTAASPPFTQDASGEPLEVPGNAFIQIVFRGATAMGDDGTSTYTGPTRFDPEFPVLTSLVRGGDFEAVTTWIVGLSQETCYRSFYLPNPNRLVIDLQQPG